MALKSKKKSYLSFNLDNETFAVSVAKVLEVLEQQRITKIPQTPDYIRGVINFRGEILPVIETRQKFNIPPIEDDSKQVIIVMDLNIKDQNTMLGATVDGVEDVLEFTDDQIQKIPEMGGSYNVKYLDGMVKLKDKFIMIMNVDMVFSESEINIVKEIINVENKN